MITATHRCHSGPRSLYTEYYKGGLGFSCCDSFVHRVYRIVILGDKSVEY